MRIWVAIVTLVLGLTGAATAADGYVARNGNDAWSGKLVEPNAAKTDGPFATLDRARGEIRKMKNAGPLPAGACASRHAVADLAEAPRAPWRPTA